MFDALFGIFSNDLAIDLGTANTLIYVKKYDEAEAELQKAITLGGAKASQAHYYLGGLYWQTGKNRQAADELEMYLKLQPKASNAEKVRTTVKELRSKS